MDIHQKLKLLSDASRYDLSCACGTNDQDRRVRGSDGAWFYPVSLPNGGFSVMLKTLMSNVCTNDCGYCPYRDAMDVPRCTVNPDEMASVFLEYVRLKKVFGIFLSSGVVGTPDNTMKLLNSTAAILRRKYSYRGYIHLKVIPGASDAAVDEALSLSNAVSVNIEAPGERHVSHLSQKKDFRKDIIGPMRRIAQQTARGMKYSRVKQSTQFIVGASDETDAEIVKYTAGLYDRLNLNRVYFSAYQRGLGSEDIPGEHSAKPVRSDEMFVREHRLYQVDFLLRNYGFTGEDIQFDGKGRLFYDRDPKLVWAQSNPQFFPVDVNRADMAALLRVPGIGPQTARRIIRLRREGKICSADALPLKGKRFALAKNYMKL
ncbi:MAG: helix-hairpin-helix domain-containing protein [Chitinispirillaceae bacterium]